ncbi:hypothetical protein [Kocuria sabuli]
MNSCPRVAAHAAVAFADAQEIIRLHVARRSRDLIGQGKASSR